MSDYDPWGQTPKYLHHRFVYFFLRSRLDLVNDDDAADAAVEMFGDQPELLSPAGEYNTFANGFAARVWSSEPARALADALAPQLDKFEAWAIHDGRGDLVDSVQGGRVEMATKATKSSRDRVPVTQAFLIFHPSDRQPPARFDPDLATDAVKAQWTASAHSAFHFANGRVLFVASDSPAITLARRLEGKFPRVGRLGGPRPNWFHEIALDNCDDGEGQLYYGDGPAWRDTGIYESGDC